MQVNFNPFPVINIERLLLRKIVQSDLNEIFFLRSDKRGLEFLDRNLATEINKEALWIEKIIEMEPNSTLKLLVVPCLQHIFSTWCIIIITCQMKKKLINSCNRFLQTNHSQKNSIEIYTTIQSQTYLVKEKNIKSNSIIIVLQYRLEMMLHYLAWCKLHGPLQ